MRLPETWPASCESRTNEVLDQVVSSIAETTKKRYISQKMLRLPHFFSTWTSHESARRNKTTIPGSYPGSCAGKCHNKFSRPEPLSCSEKLQKCRKMRVEGGLLCTYMCACAKTSVCIFLYIYIHAYMHTDKHLHMEMLVNLSAFVYTCICVYVYTYICVYVVYTCRGTCTNMHISVYINTYGHLHMGIYI